MDIAGEFDRIAKKARDSKDYLAPGVPEIMTKIDVQLNEILEDYMALPKEKKDLAKVRISTDGAWTLLAFAENMATYSLRLSNQKLFSNGLLALDIAKSSLDSREIMVILPLYCDIHKRKGLRFDSILSEGDSFSSFLKEFLDRDEDDKTLESMGYVLANDENNNPVYERTW